MIQKIVKWLDGDGNIIITYEGSGNGNIELKSDTFNEGIDRSQRITAQTVDGTRQIQILVKQLGLREKFIASDEEFILMDGGTFNVLKNEL